MTAPAGEERVLARIAALRRRRPRLEGDVVTLAHGAGGRASAALLDAVFVEAFRNQALAELGDAAVLDLPGPGRLAMTTDSFVVRPHRFPGGSVGSLAVHGTVNDLAVSGARPAWLAAAFVLEEGLPFTDLRAVVADMAAAACAAGVAIVTGDTKVVNRGAADGLYITTTGVGMVPPGRRLGADLVRHGDRLLLSGALGDHGMAVMLARGDLGLEADITSDTAALHGLVEAILVAAPATRWMRDATRGGVATVCNELALAAGVGVRLDEERLPVHAEVAAACDLLGIDPLHVANEGRLVAVVPPEQAADALAAARAHPLGAEAELAGVITDDHPGMVVETTVLGTTRVVDMLTGDPLPRIC